MQGFVTAQAEQEPSQMRRNANSVLMGCRKIRAHGDHGGGLQVPLKMATSCDLSCCHSTIPLQTLPPTTASCQRAAKSATCSRRGAPRTTNGTELTVSLIGRKRIARHPVSDRLSSVSCRGCQSPHEMNPARADTDDYLHEEAGHA